MMKSRNLKRRQFLKTTGSALGIASLAQALGSSPAWAADSGSGGTNLKAREELEKIFKELEAQGRAYLCVPRKDGEMLQLLVKATQAQHVLELGTSIGSSAIWLSLGLEETGGKLTTVEILEERVQIAKNNLARAGLAHRVTFLQGDAHEIIPTLPGPFDMVLLDADKEGQVDYFNKLYPKKLQPGGLLLSHNAIRQREKLQDYLNLVSKQPDFETIIVSATMDDGFAVSYRHRKA